MELQQQQKRRYAQKVCSDFERFWEMVVGGTDDTDFIKYVYALLFRVYEMHLDGRYLTKTQACKFIPLRHAQTSAKYLDAAEKKGFFKFEQSPMDARKIFVKPGPELVHFVEERVETGLEEIAEILSSERK